MSKGFEVHGMNEILANIEALGKNVDKHGRDALKAGAEVVQDTLERNTPKGDYTSSEHARDNVVISNLKTNRETRDKYISVGYPKHIKWRVHFVEFGTIRQQPKLFITKTVADTQSKVRRTIMDHLQKAVK